MTLEQRSGSTPSSSPRINSWPWVSPPLNIKTLITLKFLWTFPSQMCLLSSLEKLQRIHRTICSLSNPLHLELIRSFLRKDHILFHRQTQEVLHLQTYSPLEATYQVRQRTFYSSHHKLAKERYSLDKTHFSLLKSICLLTSPINSLEFLNHSVQVKSKQRSLIQWSFQRLKVPLLQVFSK